jgi:hypothetical protein
MQHKNKNKNKNIYFPQIAIQWYSHNRIDNIVSKYFPDFTVARIKYVYTVHHDGRLFARRGLDDLSALLVLDYGKRGRAAG